MANEASKQPSKHAEVKSFIKTIFLFLVLAICLRATVVEAFKIPSGSMRPTLIEHDHILVTKFNFGLRLPFVPKTVILWGQPKRGDIVVFTRPDQSGTNIIKRVIGLPGDVVEVRGRTVRVNGQLLNEPYHVQWLEGGATDFPATQVPEGHVFLMGDNRDHSKDSRFWEDSPFLDIRLIKGRAQIIYWNASALSRIGTVVR